MRLLATALFFMSFLTACRGGQTSDHSVAAKDYARACVDVLDCAPVYEGALNCCGNLPCANAAIRQDNLTTYMSDVAARMPMCTGPITPGTCRPLPACPTGRVACLNGVCAVEMPSGDAATAD